MKNVKNIIFDVGGVLMDYRWKDMLKDHGLTDADVERLGSEMFLDEEKLWEQLDYDDRPTEEIIVRYAEKYPHDADTIRWFITHGEYMHVGRPRVWELVHELKEKGYGIYLLSNYSQDLFEKHTKGADFMREIDGMVVSYMIHEIKPHAPIYEELLDSYGLDRKECIFFDDREVNVKGAEAVGIRARQVLSEEGLIGDLKVILECDRMAG